MTAFALGTWQVFRLRWKTDLIAKCEDRIIREPLPLPPAVDPDAIEEAFDYRRVVTGGKFRHDQEMLIGPRMRDGEQGYMVITPLERGDGSTVLVNRGWISKEMADQRKRRRGRGAALSLPEGEVVVEGMLRKPWKKNMFTPENRPDKGEFYFPDVKQMAELTGAQPVWIEATMGRCLVCLCVVLDNFDEILLMFSFVTDPNYMQVMEYQATGVPLSKPAEVNLRNNHAQYIFTW